MTVIHAQTYWTDQEHEVLNGIQTFEQMVEVGISLLKRMAAEGDVVQICGPMTTGGFGNRAKNMAYFRETIRVAASHGLLVFDQTPFEHSMRRLEAEMLQKGSLKQGQYCRDIVEVFYAQIFDSGLLKKLLFLPGWQWSVGATFERYKGLLCKMPIEEYPVEWLKEIPLPATE